MVTSARHARPGHRCGVAQAPIGGRRPGSGGEQGLLRLGWIATMMPVRSMTVAGRG